MKSLERQFNNIVKKNQGWVKFYRKSLDSSVFKKTKIWKVWSWCLLKANHQDNSFPFNGTDSNLKSGQFITGRAVAIAELYDVTDSEYRTILKYLKSTNRITIEANNKFSLISIVGWDEYQKREDDNQETDQPITTKQLTNNQEPTINKNDNNEKNDNKSISLADKSAENIKYTTKSQKTEQQIGLENLYNRMGTPKITYSDVGHWQEEAGSAVNYFKDGEDKRSSVFRCFKESPTVAKKAFDDCKELEQHSALYFFKVYKDIINKHHINQKNKTPT